MPGPRVQVPNSRVPKSRRLSSARVLASKTLPFGTRTPSGLRVRKGFWV